MKFTVNQKSIIICALNIYRKHCEEHAAFASKHGCDNLSGRFVETINEIDNLLTAIHE